MTTVIVVDASVLVIALADDGSDGNRTRQRLRGEVLAAPKIVDLEVCSVLRRATTNGQLTNERAGLALTDLIEMPLQTAGQRPLLARRWELRHTVTSCDAAYVALAQALRAVLVTADARLSRAPGKTCEVDVLGRVTAP